MLKKIILAASVLAIAVACTKESTVSVTCGSSVPSYSSEVSVVMRQCCTSCHGAGNARGGVALHSYGMLKQNSGGVRKIFTSSMAHEGVSISTAQRNTVVCWIDNGMPNN